MAIIKNIEIWERYYGFSNTIRDNEIHRRSFNELASRVFGGLTFEPWFRSGYWSEKFCPFVLLDRDRVVSNVSVNTLNFRYEGKLRKYIQLGTVMTDPAYRGKGLSRWLMEEVLRRYKGECDALYLFANDSVLQYYPRFGFEKAAEYQCIQPIDGGCDKGRKLDMNSTEDRELLCRAYAVSNPFSRLSFEQNPELLMFYCGDSLKDSVYYLKEWGAVVVADYVGNDMLLYDIFCAAGLDLGKVLRDAARKETSCVKFFFTPANTREGKLQPYKEEDTTLFLLKGSENLFLEDRLMFPVLSHT